MITRGRKYLLSPYLVKRVIGDYLYLNDMKAHSVSILNRDTNYLIKFMETEKSHDEIIEYMVKEYESPINVCEECFEKLTNTLYANGMLLIDGNKSMQKTPTLSDSLELSEMDNEIVKYTLEQRILFGVTLELTYNCNLSCPHCYVSKQQRDELSFEQYTLILDELKEMQVVNIVFTGGEVFFRKDALQIIKYACNAGFMVDIFTNGTILNTDQINELLRLNIHSIQCSLYYSTAQKHDKFVGYKGAFERTIRLLTKAREKGCLTAVKHCIMQDNFKEYELIKEIAQNLGAELQITYNIMPKKDGDMTPTSHRVTEEEHCKEIMRALLNDNKVKKKNVNFDECICTAGYASLSINPFGDVFVCNAFNLKVGNVKEEQIEAIWKESPIIEAWVHSSKASLKECQKCEYISYCDFCPGTALKETGSAFKKYSEACKWAKYTHDLLL